jgi:hypothetical protein
MTVKKKPHTQMFEIIPTYRCCYAEDIAPQHKERAYQKGNTTEECIHYPSSTIEERK